jgi:hypothetical protein
MAERVQQIESEIDRTRAELGSHLRELESRVDAAMDWREHVRARPYLAVGAAVAGGIMLGHLARPGRPRSSVRALESGAPSRQHGSIDARGKAYGMWEDIANGMIAVASTSLMGYIGSLVPGFAEEMRKMKGPEWDRAHQGNR